jgi:hypothetical protein
MEGSANFFDDDFSKCFNIFCRLVGADTRPAFKGECHSETVVRLKECSPKAS